MMKLTARSARLFLCSAVVAFFLVATARADDPTFGTWTLGPPAPGNLLAVHVTLLRNGKILVVGGSSFNCCFQWGHEEARLYDIATGTWSPAKLPTPAPYGSTRDAFCSGHVHDNLGNVVFQGGLLGYGKLNTHGIPDSARYDLGTGTFAPIGGGIAHWYPTLVAGVGHIFIFPGRNTEPDDAKTPLGDHIQKIAYGGAAWTTTGVAANTIDTYPRVSLLPDGRLFIASPAFLDKKNYFFDPGSNLTEPAGNDVVPETGANQIHSEVSWESSGALLPLVPSGGGYPHMQFALLNGVKNYVKDLADPAPSWKPLSTRPDFGTPEPPTRYYANSTLLPTGQLLVTGGVNHNGSDAVDAVKKGELYDPVLDAWLLTSPATVPRNYHGVALLLPDGRIWTASGSQDHSGSVCGGNVDLVPPQCFGPEKTEERVEIFTPWYVGRDDRPVITSCPASIGTSGQPFDLAIGGSQGTAVKRVLLMRAGSVTHSFDSDQRAIELEFINHTTSTVTVKAPFTAAAAPPGDYMLFALRELPVSGFKKWVPSVACWTRVATQPKKADGAAIWQYTGVPCSGNSCGGWQKLDNNQKTVAIAAGGDHHEQRLYQLHNDGMIWRYTDVVCQNDSCPGWQKVDNNPKTIAIASARTLLYELHNDGAIWRYTNTPCSGNSCPGWERLDNNPKTIAIAAGEMHLYQLHNDGAIWMSTGTPCDGESCPGWQRLDNNSLTTAIAAADHDLYQLHAGGEIWRYTGTPCSGESCPGWTRLDRNSKTVAIAAANTRLYQLHNDGAIWRFTGTPCSGESCPGWQRLDNNSKSVAISATGEGVYQLHNDGAIWRYTGTPCSGESCPGWERIGNDSRTGMLVAADPKTMGSGDPVYHLHTDPLYQLHNDGWIWRYTGEECNGDLCPGWERLDNNSKTAEIVAAGPQLFQRHTDGAIWRYTGKPCSGDSCPGWQKLDVNPKTKAIAATGSQLFQLHNDGRIWRYTGKPCASATSCTGWERLDNNAMTIAIAAAGTSLFQLHSDGEIWRSTGKACSGETCTGWQRLDNNPKATAIAAVGNQLFQLHNDGRIWRYTGTPCSGTSCTGWQMLDANPKTKAIVAGGNQLYQLHSDGRIWRYTGKPCASVTSCTGWEQLDNNPNTREIVAVANHLYQRHLDGRIWRYTGTPCSGENCPGWRLLDNNPKTKRIATGGFN
jgi:hypothetical protein